MAIKYKTVKRGEPGVQGGGTKKYYAAAISTGEADIDNLTRSIGKMSTVSGADIRAVLYALVDVMTGELAEGRIVRLGELGTIRVNISSEGETKAEDITAASIKGARTIFTPGQRLQDMLKTLNFEKREE
ncbi:MAG: DNA-binding protein [Sphingobacteriaceae bacterium]|nr:MAG: DNA-binding protein [Sphingobacteriaceae bacterium]